ncbi:DUF1684 domain-containing protein [Nocardia higoensis]|uniref:DUF1684 domain-containing protein n=1 Tax=Nocardia higoensis TaxID=228599 RepID=UPI00030FEB08|nr:DUF1684 domain-containing protein [Nocardia higoensis]
MTTTAAALDAFTATWQTWHREHETNLAAPHGFLAVTGLHWLDSIPARFPDAPGEWSTGENGVTVILTDDEELVVDGETIRGTHRFDPIPERGGIEATWGEAVLEIAKRGGHDILRPRHPDHPLRIGFRGTPAYAPDPAWVLTGHYRPFPEPRPTTVGAAVEGLEHVYDAPGEVEFEVAGQPVRLTAFPGKTEHSLTVLFTDATAGKTTYAANRILHLPAPAADGTVVLDFNRAVNLPCAYTDYATCPLPPEGNRLAVAIEAGEQIPYERRG